MSLRIRSIHGGQWKDAEFLSCSPLARLLSIALRNLADDGGVFEWKPKTIKLELLPADNCEIESLLKELVENDQVFAFEAKGKKYGCIRNFKKYQRPRHPVFAHPQPDICGNPPQSAANVRISSADVGGRREEEKTEAIASAKKTIEFVDSE